MVSVYLQPDNYTFTLLLPEPPGLTLQGCCPENQVPACMGTKLFQVEGLAEPLSVLGLSLCLLIPFLPGSQFSVFIIPNLESR